MWNGWLRRLDLACAEHAQVSVVSSERATERVAVLMTPSEKSAYVDRANSMGLSLGQFFREAGAVYGREIDEDALDAALRQLEASTARAEAALDSALAEVRRSLQVTV